MIVIYRKRRDTLVWHFHTKCSRWPESDYIQTRYINLPEDERMCDECAKLSCHVPEKPEIRLMISAAGLSSSSRSGASKKPRLNHARKTFHH